MISLSFKLLLFTLVFAPLAFGSVEHWSIMTVEIFSGVALLFCLIRLRVGGEPFLRVPGLVPLGMILGLMLVQLVPLPVGVVKLLSPQSWEAYRPVYELMGGDGWLPLSVNRGATFQEFLRIGSYGLFYVLAIQVLRTGSRIKTTLNFVVLTASVIAFFAILQQFSSGGLIYWFRPAPGGNPGGPWININQYAAFIAAISPLALGLFLFYRPPVTDDMSWRERIVSFFSSPRSNLHLFLGFGFILLVFSVFVSLCRGGIITILLSMILFSLLASFRRRDYSRMTFWVSLCLVLLAVSWLGWQPIIDEFDKAFDSSGAISDARTTLWADTLVMVKDYPIFGGGFGTYNDVYPAYKTITSNLVFEHAHNDYLELLTDGGILGFFLAAWICIAVLWHGWSKLSRRRDRFTILTGIGAITSIFALLMHSFVDFNMHNGAVGLYFFFICGLLVAIVNTRHSHYETESLLAVMPKSTGYMLIVTTFLFINVSILSQFGILVAGSSYNKVKHIYISSHLNSSIMDSVAGDMEKAMFYDPFEGLYPFYRGNLAVIREGREQAFDYYLKAAWKKPMEGIFLQRLGMMLPPEQSEKATDLMQEGYKRALNKERLVFGWAEWLLIVGQRDKAKELLRDRFETDPAQVIQMIPVLETHKFTREEVAEVLPRSVGAWIRYGDFKEKMGDIEDAEYYRSQALDYLEYETEIKPSWFAQLIHFYRRHKLPEKALAVLRLAVEKSPDYASFHVLLGDHYKKEGITYRAKEEYERAVMLEPGNESYRRRLRRLLLDIEFN